VLQRGLQAEDGSKRIGVFMDSENLVCLWSGNGLICLEWKVQSEGWEWDGGVQEIKTQLIKSPYGTSSGILSASSASSALIPANFVPMCDVIHPSHHWKYFLLF
jgi:hypothetical protein